MKDNLEDSPTIPKVYACILGIVFVLAQLALIFLYKYKFVEEFKKADLCEKVIHVLIVIILYYLEGLGNIITTRIIGFSGKKINRTLELPNTMTKPSLERQFKQGHIISKLW